MSGQGPSLPHDMDPAQTRRVLNLAVATIQLLQERIATLGAELGKLKARQPDLELAHAVVDELETLATPPTFSRALLAHNMDPGQAARIAEGSALALATLCSTVGLKTADDWLHAFAASLRASPTWLWVWAHTIAHTIAKTALNNRVELASLRVAQVSDGWRVDRSLGSRHFDAIAIIIGDATAIHPFLDRCWLLKGEGGPAVSAYLLGLWPDDAEALAALASAVVWSSQSGQQADAE